MLISEALADNEVLRPAPGIVMYKTSQVTERFYDVTRPACCMIAQGAKDIFFGGNSYRYDPDHYFLATMEMPVLGRIVEASQDNPFLALRVELDPGLVSSVMIESGLPPVHKAKDDKVMGVSPTESGLLDAALRIARLVGSPRDLKVLTPLFVREVVYRLLVGDQGARLARMPFAAGNTERIAKALNMLRKDFDKPLNVEVLARELGMSPTRFFHYFKRFTDLSPLQFQKQLRLHEARRIMLDEDLDAATAGFKVGYSDASHFSRDYRKHFGLPPARDVGKVRDNA